MTKRFDRGYFDKWYRHPLHRVGTQADLRRLVTFAVAAAEYVLTRPIRSVLDVGAGEGRWAPLIKQLRPGAKYHGIDPSEYPIRRFGARRNVTLGNADDLDDIFGTQRFDLVVCCSVINYMPRHVMRRAIVEIAAHTGGLAYLEIFTGADDVHGDTRGWYAEPAAVYRSVLRGAKLVPCGMHCYVPCLASKDLAQLEFMNFTHATIP